MTPSDSTYHNEQGRIYDSALVRLSNLLARFFFCLGVAISPLYIFPSGSPQPGDMLLALSFIFSISSIQSIRIRTAAALLPLWISLVGAGWYIVYQDISYLVPITYIAFNISVLSVSESHATTNKFFTEITALSFATSGVIVLTIWLIRTFFDNSFLSDFGHSESMSTRSGITFNNPNQLGAHGLAIIVLGLILKDSIKPWISTFLLLLGLALCSLSLSKAALVSCAFALVVFGISFIRNKDKIVSPILIVIASLPICAILPDLLINLTLNSNDQQTIVERILSIGDDNDDNFAGRGYLRIMDHPEYLILGAGESGYGRFDSAIELHSTIGSVLFCYGLPGLFLFLSTWLGSLRNNRIYFGCCLLLFLIFGLTHNGFRTTSHWIVVGIAIALSHYHTDGATTSVSDNSARQLPS